MHVAVASHNATSSGGMAGSCRSPNLITATAESSEIEDPVNPKNWNGRTNPAPDDTSPLQDTRSPPPEQHFAIFAKLPLELRYFIWRQVYLEHLESQPCVCIYQGGTISTDLDINGTKSTGGSGQRYNHSIPTVHPESFPLELISREARAVCLSEYSANQNSHSNSSTQSEDPTESEGRSAPSQVTLPSRVFNPELDTLYIDRRKRHGDGSTIVFYLGDRTRWVKHVRHIAIPFSIAIDIARHPSLLQHLKSLEKISLVFPPATDQEESHDEIPSSRSSICTKTWTTKLWSSLPIPTPAPSRRIRLQLLSQSEMSKLEIKDDIRRTTLWNGKPRSGGTGSEFIELIKQSIGNRIRRTDQFSSHLQAFYWRKEDGEFRIAIDACVFGL